MSCEIIHISAFTRSARPVSDKQPAAEATAIGNRLTPRQRHREGKPELPPPATETAKNSRIRIARRDARWLATVCRNTGRPALTGTARSVSPNNTGSPTAPHSRRLRMKVGMGWSTRGARPLRSSYLRQLPILAQSPGSARNSRAAILATFRSRRHASSAPSPTTRHFSRRIPRAACALRRNW